MHGSTYSLSLELLRHLIRGLSALLVSRCVLRALSSYPLRQAKLIVVWQSFRIFAVPQCRSSNVYIPHWDRWESLVANHLLVVLSMSIFKYYFHLTLDSSASGNAYIRGIAMGELFLLAGRSCHVTARYGIALKFTAELQINSSIRITLALFPFYLPLLC